MNRKVTPIKPRATHCKQPLLNKTKQAVLKGSIELIRIKAIINIQN